MEPSEKSLLTETYSKPTRYLLNKENIARILIMGSVMAGATLYLYTHIEGTLIYRQSMALTLLAVLQWLNAWNSRSERSIFQSLPWRNPWLVLATLTVILLQLLALYWLPLQNILHTFAISAQDWTRVLLYSLSIVAADELYKLFRRAIKKLPRFS
jgi:magnesium-transporting ATPase (P-type)